VFLFSKLGGINMKKRMVSGIKPSGKLTLGNYLGAIANFVYFQNEYDLFIFIANLHALTSFEDKDELSRNTYDLAALYLACGIDPNKVTMFIQSEVLEHASLAFTLNCFSYMGELSRMTQFKDKTSKDNETSINVGLYTYPVLMAADILIYNPDLVPVGEDQKQHVELTRDLAIRINNKLGKTFNVPQPLIPEYGARIMSLTDPKKKMSKSDDESDKGCIYLLDDLELARKKIMGAVTDSDSTVKYDKINKAGISNLLEILSKISKVSIKDLEAKYASANYGTFKKDVADAVVALLKKIQAKYEEVKASGELLEVLAEGAIKARTEASKNLSSLNQKLGIERKID
jgi:tryptophanyl-tRNA synthetase